MRWALLASVLFHVLVLLFSREAMPLPESPFSAAGPRAGDDQAAPGGGMEVVALNVVEPQVEQPPVIVPVPVPVPEPEVKPVEEEKKPQPEVVAVVAQVDGTGPVGVGKGVEVGAGIEGGRGRGDGGTTEEGRFRVVPPSPRGLILPPSDRPGKLRGKEVAVWVFVTEGGKVVADSTRVAPPTGDRKFDGRLRDQAAEWVFEPAKRGGKEVAEWFRYTIIL
jgi:outer membrane biosynthesis protein TonB